MALPVVGGALVKSHDLVQEFLSSCNARGLAPDTVALYWWALRRLPLRCSELPAQPGPIEELLGDMGVGPESKRDAWRVLKTFYRWTAKRYKVENPMGDVGRPKGRKQLPRTLTELQAQRVLQLAPCRRDLAMCAFGLDTGARCGEIAGVTRDVIDQHTVRVNGKTGERQVPLSPEVRRLLEGLGDGYHLWMGRQGPLSRSGVEQVFRKALARAGVRPPKAGPHVLRHTFGYLYIKGGGNVFALQRIMGHADISTTMIYVHMQTEDLVEQHLRASPVRRLWSMPAAPLFSLQPEVVNVHGS